MHKNHRGYYLLIATAGMALAAGYNQAMADDATANSKDNYNLLHPTPPDQLRPMSLDANDGVADATTVDAGHVQVQSSLVDYYRYTSDPFPGQHYSVDNFSWAPRITLGVLNNVDVFVHPFFHSTSYSYSGRYNASHDSSDFTDINIGAKVNLWGNDGGCTAFSVAPYVTIPNSSAPVTGGAALSFAVRLPAQFYLKFSVDPYAFANRNNDAKFGIDDSVSLHKMFGEKLDAYAYLNTDWRDGASDWSGMSGFGAGYLVTPGFELFASMGFGLTSNSYDYNPRFGIAFRF